MDRANENGSYPENYFTTVDDTVYKLAELHGGQHTMSSLAELAVKASEEEIDYDSALASIRSQMGSSLDLTVSRTVRIGGNSPKELREVFRNNQ